MCQKLGIIPETLIPLKIETFEQQDGDKDMANLHFRHYKKRRQKHLLRIFEKMNAKKEEVFDSYGGSNRNRSTEIVRLNVTNS